MPVVTAIRPGRRGQLLVELEGEVWRELPVDVVARTLLRVGTVLDRPRLRELRRELRRAEALGVAARALRYREHSHAGLDERLRRAGVAERERGQALETLERVGYVDDARFAARRAEQLAAKDWGDAAIAAELERQGVGRDAAGAAIAALEPERERALAVAGRRGSTPRTGAYLARRGFAEEALERFVAQDC
ncbi:MAG TPA: RecX family transcriptional regulator [Gaiellaceae bacterium]|nr:RecX family transcriptional regulator [Gaiellaceae bacterium]